LFKELHVDAYFLEYDDARSGNFEPLRHLPSGKSVVLGLLSSKIPETQGDESVLQRLHEASEYVPGGLESICLSHQCGFSSTQEGNELTEDEQWKKIASMVKIAKAVWGEDISQ
jgi:5-methyltetrahydropteroyltriglutamate--homocysteine methyltransferase